MPEMLHSPTLTAAMLTGHLFEDTVQVTAETEQAALGTSPEGESQIVFIATSTFLINSSSTCLCYGTSQSSS